MANNNHKKEDKGMGTGMKAGFGLAALAAAAAGAYYFYGKEGAKHRKQLKGWMVKAKGEVMERMENLRDISPETYDKVVNQVMDKYKKMKNIDPVELTALATELKGHWNKISSAIGGTAKKSPASKAPARRKGAPKKSKNTGAGA